jgi:hypothetical protein
MTEGVFDGITVGARDNDHLPNCDLATLFGELKYLNGKLRQLVDYKPLAFDFLF